MTEEYSLPKLRQAEAHGREQLDAQDQMHLFALQMAKGRWNRARMLRDEPSGAIGILRLIAECMRPSTLYFLTPAGQNRLKELEAADARTVEGQIRLAQTEAQMFNTALDVRERRLLEARANNDGSKSAIAEEKMAETSLDELVQDLRESNLSQYSQQIKHLGEMHNMFQTLPASALESNVQEEPWWPTPPENEPKLLRDIKQLEEETRGTNLVIPFYNQVCRDAFTMSESDFLLAVLNFGLSNELSAPSGLGAESKSVIRRITLPEGRTRFVRINYWPNGRIEMRGRDTQG